MTHVYHVDNTASRDSVYSVRVVMRKLLLGAAALHLTNSSCLSPLLFPMRRMQDPGSTHNLKRMKEQPLSWGAHGRLPADNIKRKQLLVGKQVKQKSVKSCGCQSLLPKLVRFLALFLCIVCHRGTQLFYLTNQPTNQLNILFN